jgi:hypothetical protein
VFLDENVFDIHRLRTTSLRAPEALPDDGLRGHGAGLITGAERAAPDGPGPRFPSGAPWEERMAWFEFKGEHLRDLKFNSEVREHLANELDGYKDKAGSIIAGLEDMAAYMPALAAHDRDVRDTLEARAKALRAVLRAFDYQETADALILSELMQRGRRPEDVAHMMRNFQETIIVLDEALDSIAARLKLRRGGAPADSQARWLVDNTIHALERAEVPLTRDQENGTVAKILRILWPAVLKREAPTELRPWLKIVRSRR